MTHTFARSELAAPALPRSCACVVCTLCSWHMKCAGTAAGCGQQPLQPADGAAANGHRRRLRAHPRQDGRHRGARRERALSRGTHASHPCAWRCTGTNKTSPNSLLVRASAAWAASRQRCSPAAAWAGCSCMTMTGACVQSPDCPVARTSMPRGADAPVPAVLRPGWSWRT